MVQANPGALVALVEANPGALVAVVEAALSCHTLGMGPFDGKTSQP